MSAMNVVILITFIVGLVLYYLSSASSSGSTLKSEEASFRGFASKSTRNRSLQLLSMVNTAIALYREMNEE